MIDISNMDKADVLARLYNASHPSGLECMYLAPDQMTVEEARDILDDNEMSFDYLYGRVMAVDLSRDEFDTQLYDRENGCGAAERALCLA